MSRIHENFLNPPFYMDSNDEIEQDSIMIKNKPFSYESLHLLEESSISSQEVRDKIIQEMFLQWKEESELLTGYFRLRNRKSALEPMTRGLANFISITTWLNGKILTNINDLLNELDLLTIKPINLNERISFVIKQPDHYHSFIQLSGLYTELEKLYYKQKITSSK
ncbi:YpoC family protein [Gottfriedia solisilvae]|uniref:YpoC family protein n=1 Tax=Gottfriedia solisilvae TaxID=1516104 RepID=UPI003D2ED247